MNLAVIPARGGSKRIPQKNLRPFLGKPIIQYSIDAALESRLFDRVVVSTDCKEISQLAVSCGAEVPFMRPAALSDDFTPTLPVVRHAINSLGLPSNGNLSVCCLYATAPMIQVSDLQASLRKLSASDLDFVFPVTTFPFPIFRALQRQAAGEGSNENLMQMIWPEHELTRSQDLPEAYHDAGQFYWGTGWAWMNCERIYSARTAGHLIPRFRVQDLDTVEDWQRAEAMYQSMWPASEPDREKG